MATPFSTNLWDCQARDRSVPGDRTRQGSFGGVTAVARRHLQSLVGPSPDSPQRTGVGRLTRLGASERFISSMSTLTFAISLFSNDFGVDLFFFQLFKVDAKAAGHSPCWCFIFSCWSFPGRARQGAN